MSINKNEIKNIFDRVSSIRSKYDEIEEITGSKFNIFKILKVSKEETRTHSAFLAEMLNPKGSHGMGTIFLKLFLQKIGLQEKYDFDNGNIDDISVKKEKFIGYINKDYTEGGYIDIFIKINDYAIIIENKIYASDQKNQLLRYYNYKNKKFTKGFKILYLTLFGKEASEYSCNNKITSKDYISISYKEFIIEWLHQCKKEVTSKPILRETISQYINLTKQLTAQAMIDKEYKEIWNVLAQNKNYELVDNITEAKNRMLKKLEKDFWQKLISILKPEVDELFFYENKDVKGKINDNSKSNSDFFKLIENGKSGVPYGIDWCIGKYKEKEVYCCIQISNAISFGYYNRDNETVKGGCVEFLKGFENYFRNKNKQADKTNWFKLYPKNIFERPEYEISFSKNTEGLKYFVKNLNNEEERKKIVEELAGKIISINKDLVKNKLSSLSD